MLNEEGAIIPEEFRMVEMFDRVDCLGKAVLGLTTGCAQCHNHKFDPLSQEEYYGLFAFLNNSYETRSNVYAPADEARLRELRRKVGAVEADMRARRPGWREEMAAWERDIAAALVPWTPVRMVEMGSSGLLAHPVQLEDDSILMLGHRDRVMIFEAVPDLDGATGLRFEALTHGDLRMHGPGRDGAWAVSELKVEIRRPDADAWERVPLVQPTADFQGPERFETKSVTKDGKQVDQKLAIGPVAYLIDGDDNTAWDADRGPLVRHQPACAAVAFEKPLAAPRGTRLRVSYTALANRPSFNHEDTLALGCCRLSLTQQPVPSIPPVDHAAILALQTPVTARSPADQEVIFAAWRRTVPEFAAGNAEIAALWRQAPEPQTTIMHLEERPVDRRRVTHLLDRGAWNRPRHEVAPHVPQALNPFPDDAPRNRLGLARWLVDARSPLAARVAVNRIWQALFGVGLVETPDDFGTRAPVPEHRELLDWLAVDFMERGWSQKQAIRQIVMSDTYRQSSRATAEALAVDPANRLLARGPRFRVDAEVVRDVALVASGLVSHTLGGPGVIPPVPQNVLSFNFFYPDYWKDATGPDRYRRSVYVFRKRSMPDPLLTSFDAPNGDVSCARRVRSNTPLAALVGLNEPIFVEAAQALALRTLREGGADDSSRIDHAFRLCTARWPRDAEKQEMLAFLTAQRRKFADGWLNPREVATGSPEKLPQLPAGTTPQDAGAWTLLARVLLNLDETVTKN
jgi:hypothetical protein